MVTHVQEVEPITKDPEYSPTLTYRGGVQGHAYFYGLQYASPLQGTHEHNAPCAVCNVSTRPIVVMIRHLPCPPYDQNKV